MKNVSIYGKKWLDLVFENKNKEYGAYKLRQEEGKTTAKAFFSSVGIIVSVLTVFVFLSSFGDKPEEITIVTIKPVSPDIFTALPEKPKAEQKQQAKSKPKDLEILKTATMKVVQTAEADLKIPTNDELPKTNNTATINGSETGTLPATTDGEGGGTAVEPIKFSTTIENAASLDKQPLFPGGMERFYAYVGRTFEKPEMNEPKTVRILVSFVIERDGDMTDINVLSRTNEALNNEAIRVLKSLKTKWSPGIKNGTAVRTQYTLPITVVAE